MQHYDVYLYGMILKTNSFLLMESYPEPDTYGEIKEKYSLPGGETGTCATVLANLGCSIKMDGNHMGVNTYPLMESFYKNKSVDYSSLYYDKDYDGLEDYVLIDKHTRTPFGTFQHYFSDDIKRWNIPKKEDIAGATVVGLDPFFQEASLVAAQLCHELGKPYVIIDCPFDSELHQFSSINVVSNEFISNEYKDELREELFKKYIENTEGLVIFTLGTKEIIYGRKGEEPHFFKPYQVDVVSTLGAGDTFKAGCVYALLNKMSDEQIVSFSSASAAIACTHFPLPLNPPCLVEIEELGKSEEQSTRIFGIV